MAFELQLVEFGKKCGACLQRLPIGNFHRCASSNDGLQPCCKVCQRKRRVAGLNKMCAANPKLEWAKQSVAAARYRSKGKDFSCEIDVHYISSIAPDFCPVFGFKLRYSTGLGSNKRGGDFDSASIDRIDPNGGYVRGNVVVISRKANVTKNNCSVEQIRQVANWLEFVQSLNKG